MRKVPPLSISLVGALMTMTSPNLSVNLITFTSSESTFFGDSTSASNTTSSTSSFFGDSSASITSKTSLLDYSSTFISCSDKFETGFNLISSLISFVSDIILYL